MPNFKVRRRKKTKAPEKKELLVENNAEEEKYDDAEMVAGEDDQEFIENALNELRILDDESESDKMDIEPQSFQETMPQKANFEEKNPYLANFVAPKQKQTSFDQYLGPSTRINDPFRKMTRTLFYPLRRKQKKPSARFRYRTHYGAQDDYIDTHTKSKLLYNHCFG